ncbi:hypothetical protein PSG09_20765 [Escherichia coli]
MNKEQSIGNSGMVGKQLFPQEMQQLHPGDEEAWRRIDSADGEPVLKFIASFNRCLLLECTGCAICSSMPQHHKQFSSLSTPVIL